jgi:hypothetical protein
VRPIAAVGIVATGVLGAALAAVDPDPLRTMSGSASPTLDAATLAVDPYVVLDLARFHLQHPECRAEPATDAGQARLDALRRAREVAAST